MIFRYKAFEKNILVKGKIEADTKDNALHLLKNQGLRPVAIEEDIGNTHALEFHHKFTKKDYAMIFRQLSILLLSGISFDRSIQMVSGQYHQKKEKVLKSVYQHLVSGEMLWKSFELTEAFSPFICNMIEVGERSSNLPTVFSKLSDFYRKQEEFQKKMISALTYPIILTIVTICILNFLMLEIIPGFEEIFQDAGNVLPWPTRFLLGMSRFMRDYGIFFFIGILAAIGMCCLYYKKNPYPFHKLKFRSRRLTKYQGLQFSFAMSILLSAGMRMEEALMSVKEMERNLYARRIFEHMIVGIQKGLSFSQVCREEKLFPEMMNSMIYVGEESSKLPAMFQYIYEFYNSEMEMENRRFITLLEPIFILLLAIVVGFIVIAIAFPIFDMANQV